MGFFDALLGRRKLKGPDLDALFAVPTAALTLEVSAGLTPTGSVGVCYRDPEGAPFDRIEADLTAMLQASRPVLSRDRHLSLIHISEPTRQLMSSRMPSSA